MDDAVRVVRDEYQRMYYGNTDDWARVGWASLDRQQTRLELVVDALLMSDFSQHLPMCESVLDVGCGVGEFVFMLEKYGYDGLAKNYMGIDIVPEFLDRARALHPGVGFRNINMLEINKSLIGPVQMKADLVVGSGILAHYGAKNRLDLIAQMWRSANKLMVFNATVPETFSNTTNLIITLESLSIYHYIIRRDYMNDDVTVYCFKKDM